MNNHDVILKLKVCVEKLEHDISVLEEKSDGIPSDTPEQIQQQRKLTNIVAKMIAEQNSLETILRERKAIDDSAFSPLDESKTAQFLFQMNILNLVIQADQSFDQIVAVANGIRSAADEIEKITE